MHRHFGLGHYFLFINLLLFVFFVWYFSYGEK